MPSQRLGPRSVGIAAKARWAAEKQRMVERLSHLNSNPCKDKSQLAPHPRARPQRASNLQGVMSVLIAAALKAAKRAKAPALEAYRVDPCDCGHSRTFRVLLLALAPQSGAAVGPGYTAAASPFSGAHADEMQLPG